MTCPALLVGGRSNQLCGVPIALAHGRNQIMTTTCNFKRSLFIAIGEDQGDTLHTLAMHDRGMLLSIDW